MPLEATFSKGSKSHRLNFGSQILHQWVLESQSLRKHTRLFITKMGNGQRSEREMQGRRPWLLKHSRGEFGEHRRLQGCTGRQLGRNKGWPDLHPGPVPEPIWRGPRPWHLCQWTPTATLPGSSVPLLGKMISPAS